MAGPRIFRWTDAPEELRGLLPEQREYLALVPAELRSRWESEMPVQWVNVIRSELPDGDELVAGDEPARQPARRTLAEMEERFARFREGMPQVSRSSDP